MKDWTAMRKILDRVDSRIKERGWSKIAQEERDAANVDAFYGCVLNGGIDSLFFNSPYLGNMVDELVVSLERVGAKQAAKLVREAFGFFPDGQPPATLDARVECLRGRSDYAPFEELSRRFLRSGGERRNRPTRVLQEASDAFFPRDPTKKKPDQALEPTREVDLCFLCALCSSVRKVGSG